MLINIHPSESLKHARIFPWASNYVDLMTTARADSKIHHWRFVSRHSSVCLLHFFLHSFILFMAMCWNYSASWKIIAILSNSSKCHQQLLKLNDKKKRLIKLNFAQHKSNAKKSKENAKVTHCITTTNLSSVEANKKLRNEIKLDKVTNIASKI